MLVMAVSRVVSVMHQSDVSVPSVTSSIPYALCRQCMFRMFLQRASTRVYLLQ